MLKKFLLQLICLLPLINSVAFAAPLEGLYRVTVPVDSQSSRDLQRGSEQGFREVLVRASGNARVLENAAVQESLAKAKPFVNQYGYQQTQSDEGGPLLLLQLDFEGALVEQLLRENGLPFWPANRPSLLIWLVIDAGSGPSYFTPELYPDMFQHLRDELQRRGLVASFPLFDLEDRMTAAPEQLWQLNSLSADQIAHRYGSDMALIGRVSQLSSGQWLGSWLLSGNQQYQRYDGELAQPLDYISAIVDAVADQLAEQYAIVPTEGSEQGVLTRIEGISNFQAYIRTVKYLEGLAMVSHAVPVSVEGDVLLLRLLADGQLHQLEQSIALDRQLVPVVVSPLAADSATLHYRWQGR
jgi:hypothetical protein